MEYTRESQTDFDVLDLMDEIYTGIELSVEELEPDIFGLESAELDYKPDVKLRQLCHEILRRHIALLDVYAMHIRLKDNRTNELIIVAGGLRGNLDNPYLTFAPKSKRVGDDISGLVAGMGKPHLTGDLHNEFHYKRMVSNFSALNETSRIFGEYLEKANSEIVIPLKAGDEIYGFATAQSSNPEKFSANTARLFGSLMNRTLQELGPDAYLDKTSIRELLRFAFSFEQELRRQIQCGIKIFQAHTGHVGLYNHKPQEIVYVTGVSPIRHLIKRHKLGGDLFSNIVKSSLPYQVVENLEKDPHFQKLKSEYYRNLKGSLPNKEIEEFLEAVKSEMVVALHAKDEIIGFAALKSKAPNAFGESDCQDFQKLMNQVSNTVESFAADSGIPVVDLIHFCINFRNALSQKLIESLKMLEVDYGHITHKLRNKQRFKILEGHYLEFEQACVNYHEFLTNIESEFAIPLQVGGRVIGTATVKADRCDYFNDRTKMLFISSMQHAATLIENFQFNQKIKHLLANIANMIDSQDLDQVLQALGRASIEVLRADIVAIFQYDQSSNTFLTPHLIDGVLISPEFAEMGIKQGFVPEVMVRKNKEFYCTYVKDMQVALQEPESERLVQQDHGFVYKERIESAAGLLLKAKDEIVGIMFFNFRHPQDFSENQKNLMRILASQGAIAIQQARQFERAQLLRNLEVYKEAFGKIAHRLRNVLPIISDEIDFVLSSGKVSGEAVESCRIVLEENRRAQRIVRDFGKVAELRFFERSQEFWGRELVEELGKVVKRTLSEQNARIQTAASSDLPSVKVNLDRLKDDFANFARDSDYHTPKELCVSINCELASQADLRKVNLPNTGCSYLKLIYTDNGPGIPPKLKTKIFEPFETTTDGSGLGLAITKSTIQLHGGTVIECGEPGKGVRFELYLPIS